MSTPLSPPSRPRSPAPVYRRTPLRVACVQYDAKLGQVEANAKRVEQLTHNLRPGSLDLLVLPEMALSGYIFPTPVSVLPYLEPQRVGPTSLLARSLAKRLRCHVVAGYPEALPSTSRPEPGTSRLASINDEATGGDSGDMAGPSSMKALEGEGEGVGWNSAMVVGPTGDVLGNYRKTFRFETDKNWAKEGDGFCHWDLPEPIGRLAIGICMDMNPKDFLAPWDAFELASYCRDNGVDTLVVPMNWLDPPTEPPDVPLPLDHSAPSEHNLNYWAARLTPLHDPTPGYVSPNPDRPAVTGEDGKEVVFVGCNRVGEEEGTRFIGTSCVMALSSSPPRIELVEVCNMSEERVLLATVT